MQGDGSALVPDARIYNASRRTETLASTPRSGGRGLDSLRAEITLPSSRSVSTSGTLMFSHTDLTRIDLIGSRPPPLSFGLHRIAPFQPLSAPTADSNVSATTPCHSLRIQDNRKDLQVLQEPLCCRSSIRRRGIRSAGMWAEKLDVVTKKRLLKPKYACDDKRFVWFVRERIARCL